MKKKILLVGTALVLTLAAGCAEAPAQLPAVLQTEENKMAVTELTRVVTADTIADLDAYPNLVKVDLRGSTCYDAIIDYISTHPDVQVRYDVNVGGKPVDSSTTALPTAGYDHQELMKGLQYLPAITEIDLGKTTWSLEQLTGLQETYPDIQVRYSVVIGDQELTQDTAQLDFSTVEWAQLEQYKSQLPMLTNLQTINLMKEDGTSLLTMDQVVQLQEAVPGVLLKYQFELFGKTVTTDTERIEFVNQDIGNQGEPQLRQALTILTGCNYLLLDECGLDNEVLATLREDFPNTEVVWRIHQTNKKRSWLTDTETLRAVYGVDDTNSDVFKYCTKVKYMDFGHNEEMVDLSFLAYMPDLEICLLSGSPIKDLTPLANCKKLEFLELSWCGHLKDVSPLVGCESLKYLNLGHTKVSDVTVLQGLPLEMLSYVGSSKGKLTAQDWEEIQELMPNCWITWEPLQSNSATPYGEGWRYAKGGGYTEIYRKVRDVFGYDEIDKKLQNKN